ncbi:MAG: preprotein translocase subunit SecG [Ruminococcaceae bacterium]|nr:preprotein translocase subunit SecG [Oscillospiraceae bacterium]
MPITQLLLGGLLAIVSVCLIIAVLLQPGKDKRLSGAIAGGTESYLAKGKAGKREQALNKATVAMCIVFFVAILVLYCIAAV